MTVRVDGKRAEHDLIDGGEPRRWRSSGVMVDPDSARRKPRQFSPKGRHRARPLQRARFKVHFAAGQTRKIVFHYRSVGGSDLATWPKTTPEVSFAGTGRDDHILYQHEIRLTDPEARPRPGGKSGKVPITIEAPAGLRLVANIPLECKSRRRPDNRKKYRACRGTIDPAKQKHLRMVMGEDRKRIIGFFATVGFGATNRGAGAWFRAGVQLMLRKRNDLLTLSVETNARKRTRVTLGLTYQMCPPYSWWSHAMGGHGELGVVLDVTPKVRPAIRVGGAFHFYFARITLLFDFYPGEIEPGGSVAWRLLGGLEMGL